MSLDLRFTVNKRELTAFEEFMTGSLQAEIEKAYAMALNRLGKGCAKWMKRQLEKTGDTEDLELAYSGIVHVPRTVKRILQLNPIRSVIGAGSVRNRHPDKSNLVGRPFKVRVKNESGENSVGLIAQRTRDSRHFNADELWGTQTRHVTVTPSGRKIISRKKYGSHQEFIGYRNTELPIKIISHIHLNNRQKVKFRYMVEEYMATHHDKVVECELKKGMERAAKKK